MEKQIDGQKKAKAKKQYIIDFKMMEMETGTEMVLQMVKMQKEIQEQLTLIIFLMM